MGANSVTSPFTWVGCYGAEAANQIKRVVNANVHLHAEVPLIIFSGLVHFWRSGDSVTFSAFVLDGTWAVIDGRIDNAAFAQHQAILRHSTVGQFVPWGNIEPSFYPVASTESARPSAPEKSQGGAYASWSGTLLSGKVIWSMVARNPVRLTIAVLSLILRVIQILSRFYKISAHSSHVLPVFRLIGT